MKRIMSVLMIFVVMVLVALTGCGDRVVYHGPQATPQDILPAPVKTETAKTPTKLVSPNPIPALPWWGDPNYPIIHDSKPMDVLQIMAFGLRPAVLTEEWTALNWFEKQ